MDPSSELRVLDALPVLWILGNTTANLGSGVESSSSEGSSGAELFQNCGELESPLGGALGRPHSPATPARRSTRRRRRPGPRPRPPPALGPAPRPSPARAPVPRPSPAGRRSRSRSQRRRPSARTTRRSLSVRPVRRGAGAAAWGAGPGGVFARSLRSATSAASGAGCPGLSPPPAPDSLSPAATCTFPTSFPTWRRRLLAPEAWALPGSALCGSAFGLNSLSLASRAGLGPEKPASSGGRTCGCPRGGWRPWLFCPAQSLLPQGLGSPLPGLPVGPLQARPLAGSTRCLSRDPRSLPGVPPPTTLPRSGARRCPRRRCFDRRCWGARRVPALALTQSGGLQSPCPFPPASATVPGPHRSGCRFPGPRGLRCPGKSCSHLHRRRGPHRGSGSLGSRAELGVSDSFLSSCGGIAPVSSLLRGYALPPGARHGCSGAETRVPDAARCLVSPGAPVAAQPLALCSCRSPLRRTSGGHQGSRGLPKWRAPKMVWPCGP